MRSEKLHFLVLCSAFFLLQARPAQNPGQQPGAAPVPKTRHRFIVVAHRGLHNVFPENSLAAFDAGARAGVDYVEMDLRTTKDSVLVIMHDATLDRTTNGKGAVAAWNYADLSGLKLNGSKPGTAAAIPTFVQVLALCRNRVGIYLDFKSASVSRTMKLIRRFGMAGQFIVYINSPEQYRQWRTEEPAIPLMLSIPDSVKTAESLQHFLSAYPAALLDGDYSSYTKEMVAAAAQRQVPVWPDIQSDDESDHWQTAVALGLRGLQTDHPEALIKWLEERKLR